MMNHVGNQAILLSGNDQMALLPESKGLSDLMSKEPYEFQSIDEYSFNRSTLYLINASGRSGKGLTTAMRVV